MIKKKITFWDRLVKNFSLTYIGQGKFLYYYKNSRTKRITYGKLDLVSKKARLSLSIVAFSVIMMPFFLQYFHGNPAPANPRHAIVEKGTEMQPLDAEQLQQMLPSDGVHDDQQRMPILPESQHTIQDEEPNTDIKSLREKSNDGNNESSFLSRLLAINLFAEDEDLQRTKTILARGNRSNVNVHETKNLNVIDRSEDGSRKPTDLSQEGSYSQSLLHETQEMINIIEQGINEVSAPASSELENKIINSGPVGTSIEDFETENLKRAALLSDNSLFTPESDSDKVKIHHYTVRRGDNVGKLSRKFGVSSHTIGGSSKKITNMDEIWPGTKLVVPSKDGILVQIQQGQSLAMISNKYKISLDKLIRVNNFEDPDNLSVGEYVFLPDVKPKNLFTGFLWPVRGRLSSGYGWRYHPILRKRHFHEGIDIAVAYTGVRSAKSGKVVYAGWMGAYGKVVIISHPGNFKTLYAHNSRLYVRVGQHVKQGQWIARSGNTGRSTGPHVHFEVWRNDRPVNPHRYLKK